MSVETTILPTGVTQYSDALAIAAVEGAAALELPTYQKSAEKDAASGYAGLDADGDVLNTHLPYAMIASDALLGSSDTELLGLAEIVFTKRKEIQVLVPGVYRVKYAFGNNNGGIGNCQANVYKNGVAVGTQRGTAADAYVVYSQDLTFAEGDLVQLYSKNSDSTSHKCKEFRVYGTFQSEQPVVNL